MGALYSIFRALYNDSNHVSASGFVQELFTVQVERFSIKKKTDKNVFSSVEVNRLVQ